MQIEYLNNLTTRRISYKGSGTINVFGGSEVIVVDAYGKMDVLFEDKEWVYDLNHNQYQIVGLYNAPNAIVWAAYGMGEIRFFSTEELLNFEQGPSFFERKYKIIIQYYESLLIQVNSKIQEYFPANATAKFSYSTSVKSSKSNEKLQNIVDNLQKIQSNMKRLNKNVRLRRSR